MNPVAHMILLLGAWIVLSIGWGILKKLFGFGAPNHHTNQGE